MTLNAIADPRLKAFAVPKLGEILRRRGYVGTDQLRIALERQRGTKHPLGEILVELNTLTHDQLHAALREQLRLQLISGTISMALSLGKPCERLAGHAASLHLAGLVDSEAWPRPTETEIVLPGDLVIPTTGRITTVSVMTNAATGYVVQVRSRNAARFGLPILTHIDGKRGRIAYSLALGNEAICFDGRGGAVLAQSDRPSPTPTSKELSITTEPIGRPNGGSYADTLDFTMVYNP
jgi:hypothetical protein